MKAEEIIKERCVRWYNQLVPGQAELRPNGWPYFYDFRNSFFGGLSDQTERDLSQGSGGELRGKDPKAKALRSSTVLVVNFMQYWREVGQVGILAHALFGNERCQSLTFESKHSTGVKGGDGRPANLDAEFSDGDSCFAVEGKFSEPFGSRKKLLKQAYFETPDLWNGLKKCHDLAVRMGEHKLAFKHLDAAQLLKHTLALTKTRRERNKKGTLELLYLWYAPASAKDCVEVEQHEREIEQFAAEIEGDMRFRSKTYQQVFKALSEYRSAHPSYFDYMETRYFPEFKS